MDKAIRASKALEKLRELGFDENTLVYYHEGKNVVSLRFTRIGSTYSPIAPCGKHTSSECLHKWTEMPECKNCTKVNHVRDNVYKVINGVRCKRCKRCGRYLPEEGNFYSIREGKSTSGWCKECSRAYSRERNRIRYQKQKAKKHEEENLQDALHHKQAREHSLRESLNNH